MAYQIVTNLIEIGTLISGGVVASYSLANGIQGSMNQNKQKKVDEQKHDTEVKNFQKERHIISMVMLGLQSLDPQLIANFTNQNQKKIKDYISTLSYKNIDPFRKEANRRLQPEIRRISIIILKQQSPDPSKINEQDIQSFMQKINTSNIFEYIDLSEKIFLAEKKLLVMYIKGFRPEKDNKETFYQLYEKQILEEVQKINSQNIESYRKEAEQKLGPGGLSDGRSLTASAGISPTVVPAPTTGPTSVSKPTNLPTPSPIGPTSAGPTTSTGPTPTGPTTSNAQGSPGLSKEEKEKKYFKQVEWQKQRYNIFNRQKMDYSSDQKRLPKEEIQQITKHREKTTQDQKLQQLANKKRQQQQ